MPYRRLPNTDQARLKALRKAVERADEADFADQVLNYKTLGQARQLMMRFENLMARYHEDYHAKIISGKKYRHVVQHAKMYVSHFIQVLNLSVIRGEIKKEQKLLYGLDPNNHIVPDLSHEEDLLTWGNNVINGEQKRIQAGGFPIYNPSINKVQVHFDIFKEWQFDYAQRRKMSGRVVEEVATMRQEADTLILDIWNQVEEHYKDCLPYARMVNCQKYGVIYYYRPGENIRTPETDREYQRQERMQTTLNLEE